MKKVADTLFLLATFSLRGAQINKALEYSSAGLALFPGERRLIEVHSYALLLLDRHADAEKLLSSTPEASRNLDFLRGRTAILLDMPPEEKRNRLRRYLAH